MLRIDPFVGYTLCGAGSLVGGMLMGLASTDDPRMRQGLRICGWGFFLLGLGQIQYLLFNPVPRGAVLVSALGVVVGTGLFGWGFARLGGRRLHPWWLRAGVPALVLLVLVGHALPGRGFAISFELAAALIATWVLWANRLPSAGAPHGRMSLILAVTLGCYMLSWWVRLAFTLAADDTVPHLLTVPDPGRTLYSLLYAVTPVIVAVLVLDFVNVELNERLRRRAITDELTGLYSRRGLFEQALALQRGAMTRGEQVAVLLFDVDHFKLVNDQHGHGAGDEALRHIARVLVSQVRGDALVARHGGEEFVALVPARGQEDCHRVAERMRAAVASSLCRVDTAVALRLTVSVGVAMWHPDESLTAPIARADGAMYRAKAGGRNRVEADAA